MPFGVPGEAWVAFMEPLGAYENVKKPLVFVLFSAFGSSRGLLRSLFFVFFLFPIVFSVFPIVFAFVFRFPIVFSVSSGAIRLHECIHGRDSAPQAIIGWLLGGPGVVLVGPWRLLGRPCGRPSAPNATPVHVCAFFQ